MKKSILLIIIIIVLIFLGVRVKRFISIDKCLDNGGRWDYKAQKCIKNEKVILQAKSIKT